MRRFRLLNSWIGWGCFVTAFVTYLLTLEPTASFWDCPEFITQGFKLETGHAPGSPVFTLTARFFANFAGGDVTKVAWCVNAMSALFSAATVLLLFWTITHLGRRLVESRSDKNELTPLQSGAVLASGVCGALMYAWSDTFWFSAVEAEVYAYSSLCTALVFWLILKWEERADTPAGDRLLMLVAYVMGLSIGVHLLNLLCIPGIVTVIYYRSAKCVNIKGLALATLLSVALLFTVLYGLIPGMPVMAQYAELLTVNVFGWSINSGAVAYAILLLALFAAAMWAIIRCRSRRIVIVLTVSAVALSGLTMFGGSVWAWLAGVTVIATVLIFRQISRRWLLTGVTSLMLMFTGYASYGVVLMRSAADTPMNEGSPSDLFSLSGYLARDQYGKAPLFYGDTPFATPVSQLRIATGGDGKRTVVSSPIVEYDTVYAPGADGRYERVPDYTSPVYTAPSELKMVFPRIHSPQHIVGYTAWISGFSDTVDALEMVCPMDLADTLKQQFGTDVAEDLGMKPGKFDGRDMMIRTKRLPKPSQADNMRFMLNYQLGQMYWRYFLWNFAGRQNDILNENGEHTAGNWLTGFPLLDNYRLGDQSLLPAEKGRDNAGHNIYYCIPLLLGYAGLLLQLFSGRRGRRQAWVVALLFLMTGLAIVIYLNQTTTEPRERDYAFAGSFYAYAIWVGLGILGLWTLACHFLRGRKAQIIVTAACGAVAVAVPLQVVSQTWDDHDRSGRTMAVDMARNYLESLEPDAIIFTFGDNDTFPLWYAQEVEGVRRDVRVINSSYLAADWYIDQMRRPAYEAAPVPMSAPKEFYRHGRFRYAMPSGELPDSMELRVALDSLHSRAMAGPSPSQGLPLPLHPVITVDARTALAAGRITEADLRSGRYILGPDSTLRFTLDLSTGGAVTTADIMTLDIIATSMREGWRRPVYFTSPGFDAVYSTLRRVGLPREVRPDETSPSRFDTEKAYDNITTRYRFGGLESGRRIYLDPANRQSVSWLRSMIFDLATDLAADDRQDGSVTRLPRIRKLMALMDEKMPPEATPYTMMELYTLSNLYQTLDAAYPAQGYDAALQAILEPERDRLKQYIILGLYADQTPGLILNTSDRNGILIARRLMGLLH